MTGLCALARALGRALALWLASLSPGAVATPPPPSPKPVLPEVNGRVVKVLKDAVVFEKPSTKSRVMADVGPGTVLLARKLSPRGFWLLVEDEDKNRGWIDRRLTDLAPAAAAAAAGSTSSPRGVPEPLADEGGNKIVRATQGQEPGPAIGGRRVWLIGARLRKAFSDPHGDVGLGLGVTGLFALEEGWLGGELGGLGYGGGLRGGWSLPARLVYALPDAQGARLMGGDVGVHVLRYPASAGGSWALSPTLGIFLHRAFRFGGLWGIRASMDFLQGTRFGLECSLGWVL